MNLSSAAANAVWDGGLAPQGSMGSKNSLQYGIIELWSGPMPTDANNATNGTLLCVISSSSGAWAAGASTNGLQYSAPTSGVIGIGSGQTFSGTAVATGTIGYARMKGNKTGASTDGNATDSVAAFVRVDLTVSAGGGAECNLSTLNAVSGVPITVTSVTLTQPRS
jgi:hypothetical protein